MSLRAYARHRGVNLQAVQNAIASKRISTIPDEKGRARIDPAVADIQWARNTDPVQQARAYGGNPPPQPSAAAIAIEPPPAAPGPLPARGRGDQEPTNPAFIEAKTSTEQYRAQLLLLEIEEKAGSLVRRADVERELGNLMAITREAILTLPDRVASVLAGETDTKRCHTLLRDEMSTILDAVADWAKCLPSN